MQREGKKRNSGGKRKDFEFAKSELIERQNERWGARVFFHDIALPNLNINQRRIY